MALARATGEWIAVVDSDDLMDSQRLATLVAAAVRDRADIVADNLIEFSSDGRNPPHPMLTGQWADAPFWVDIVDYVRRNDFYKSAPAIGYLKPMFRASLLSSLSDHYNETLRIAEDYDLVLRLMHRGAKFRVYPMQLYFYRKHTASISHRLSESVLDALASANRSFLNEISASDPRLTAALLSRMRSIDTALAYERLLTALKARNWIGAISIVCFTPRAAALLRLPLLVRLRRFTRIGTL
jgi:hypothetical protein